MPTKKITLPTLRELVDAGAHFGHRRSRSHPKARKYVYTIRDRVLVFNLEHTQAKLDEALQAAEQFAAQGKKFLFVGTKPQAAEVLKQAAEAAGQPYVNQRWLGGTLTNYETIRRNLKKLERLEELFDSQEIDGFTKKERVGLNREREKLAKIFGGIRSLDKLPDVMVVVDIDQENIAVLEATKLGIPVIAIADTNVDPTRVDYPIPANDDSRKTIQLILNLLATVIADGATRAPKVQLEELQTAVAADTGATKAERMDAATTTEATVAPAPTETKKAPTKKATKPTVKKTTKKSTAK